MIPEAAGVACYSNATQDSSSDSSANHSDEDEELRRFSDEAILKK